MSTRGINPRNPEVEQAIADVDAGTMEARRLLISETSASRESIVERNVFEERIVAPDQWRHASVDLAIRYYERIFGEKPNGMVGLLTDADAIFDYIMVGAIPTAPITDKVE